MNLTPKTFIIVCPFLFLAGFVDSIGGGGGLISLPAYLIAGLPVHQAIATNKMSSTFGTTLATIRFIKNRLVNFRIAVLSVLLAVIGASIGANLSLLIPEKIMHYILFIVLPVSAFIVLNKQLFKESDTDDTVIPNLCMYLTAAASAFTIGLYDGFYGPGTGTFLIISFTVFAKMSIRSANAHAKVINLTSNVTSLVVFLFNGQIILPLGFAAAVCHMAGSYLGSGLVLAKGAKIVRPILIIVLFLLLLKILGIF